MKKYLLFISLVVCFALLSRFIFVASPQVDIPKPTLLCTSTESLPNSSTQSENFKGVNCQALAQINQEYLAKVKPIFNEKCLMCHGKVEKMPLYSKIPLISWLVTSDIEEGKQHLDMSYDYPFYSSKKKTVDFEKQLQRLSRTIEKDEMPPWYYEIVHWESELTSEEKKIVLSWIHESQERLKAGER